MSLITSPDASFEGPIIKEKTVKIIVSVINSIPIQLCLKENFSEHDFYVCLEEAFSNHPKECYLEGNLQFFIVEPEGELIETDDLTYLEENTTLFLYNEKFLDFEFKQILRDLNVLDLAPGFYHGGIIDIESLKLALLKEEMPTSVKNNSRLSLWEELKEKVASLEK